jgi:hypothetical protein
MQFNELPASSGWTYLHTRLSPTSVKSPRTVEAETLENDYNSTTRLSILGNPTDDNRAHEQDNIDPKYPQRQQRNNPKTCRPTSQSNHLTAFN